MTMTTRAGLAEEVARRRVNNPLRVFCRRDAGPDQEWFVDDPELPSGEFVAGPFPDKASATFELERIQAMADLDLIAERRRGVFED